MATRTMFVRRCGEAQGCQGNRPDPPSLRAGINKRRKTAL